MRGTHNRLVLTDNEGVVTPLDRGLYTVIDHARITADGIEGFYKLVAPRYRRKHVVLFSNELRLLHHLKMRRTHQGDSSFPGTLMLLTVHRRGSKRRNVSSLGPVVGSAIMTSPGGLLCSDLDPSRPGMAAAVAAYLYDRFMVDRASASVRTKAPTSVSLDQRLLSGALPTISGETGAASVMSAMWEERSGLTSRVMVAQQVLELTPEAARTHPLPSPSVEGHAELSGSPKSSDDALRALIQDYADHGPSSRTPSELPQLSGVLPPDSVSVQKVLAILSNESATAPIGDVFARSSRELGDRTVLWVTDTHDKVRYPVALAHLTHPVESVIRIGPVHAIRGEALSSIAAAQTAHIPIAASHPSLRGREVHHHDLLADDPHTVVPRVSGGSEEILRRAYMSAAVSEAARLALRAGAKHVVLHTRLDEPDERAEYQYLGFTPVGSLIRLSISPGGTIPLH